MRVAGARRSATGLHLESLPWITVGPEATGNAEVEIKDFVGGLYAVSGCTLTNITEVWHRLVIAGEDSRYMLTAEGCLEECLAAPAEGADPAAMHFDLYLAIAER